MTESDSSKSLIMDIIKIASMYDAATERLTRLIDEAANADDADSQKLVMEKMAMIHRVLTMGVDAILLQSNSMEKK